MPWLAFALGTALSLLVFELIRVGERASLRREFERRASNVTLRVEDYLLRNVEPLYALRNLFNYSQDVSREEFAGAARDLISRSVSVQALEWVPLVAAADRARTEARVRAEGFPDFQFTERISATTLRRATNRHQHFPVLYVEPYADNKLALGFDLASGASWPVLEKISASGQLGASGRLPLLTEKNAPNSWAYIMQLPVYDRPLGTPNTTPKDLQLRGFILGVFRLRDLLEAMFNRMGGLGVEVLFLDRSAPPDRQFLHHHTGTPGTDKSPPTVEQISAGLHVTLPLEHAGRRWELWARPADSWLAAQPLSRSWLVLAFGLMFSGWLGIFLRSQQRRTAVIEQLVDERTAELSESQRQLDSIVRTLPGMVYRCRHDAGLTVIYVSDGTFALTGYHGDEFISGAIHFRDITHPDDLLRISDDTRTALKERRPVEVEYRIRHRDGTYKWLLSRGRGIYTADGSLQFLEGLAIDITAQKNSEAGRLLLERKLLDSQKLESLGLLAGGIAHDFNNLLTVILGSASLTRLDLPPGSTAAETSLRQIEVAGQRAAELCSQMLAYAGKGRFVVEPANLSLVLDGLHSLLKISVGHRATLFFHLNPDLPAVMADATQLRQIVMNLVINAAEAIGDRGGEITLTTGLRAFRADNLAHAATGADRPAGDYVFLEVRDTGPGMAPGVLAKIFDPFFTTKFTGRGLGLAAVLGIVRGHDGALLVESAAGLGTAFTLILPPIAGAVATPARAASTTPWHQKASVLVIDDDDSVRTVATAMLRSSGFNTQAAADGLAGLAAFKAEPIGFDLVVLDLLMPGLTGEQTLVELRRVRPGVRVLIISGFNEGDLLTRHAGGGQLAYLHKPFTRGDLERSVRDLLD
ncbi:MAG: CHASE domain-containing protein [Undibacterium sp.]|nr:CHASE domain-containing protein [Opitutaceae bacterium]